MTDTLSAFQNNGVLVTDARNGVTKTRVQIDTAAAALAGSVLWNGSTSTDWATPANWSSGRVPNRLDNVSIPAAPSGARFPLISGTAQAANVSIADGAQLNMSSGTLTVYGNWEVLGAGFFNRHWRHAVGFAGSLNQSIAMTSSPKRPLLIISKLAMAVQNRR